MQRKLGRLLIGCGVLVLCCWLAGPSGLWAQQSAAQTSAPKYSNEFLKIGVGARAAALGNSVSAVSEDVTAGYWNPASLVHTPDRIQIGLMHSEYFAGIAKYDYAAFSTPLEGDRRLAISYIRMGIDDIPNTLNFKEGNTFNYARITEFSVVDQALLVSYAQPLKFWDQRLSIGGNFKVVNRRIGPFANAWGFGLDAGLHYRHEGLRLSFVASDITNTFNAWTFNTETFEDAFRATQNEIPQNSIELTLPSLRIGAGYHFLQGRKVTLLAAFDSQWFFDGQRNTPLSFDPMTVYPSMGLELGLWEVVYLRGGIMNVQNIINDEGKRVLDVYPTAGVGINFKGIRVDYALSNIGDFSQTLYSHLISLQITLPEIKL
jgi:hypothetical protein